jgi:hypothetical protein
MKRLGLILLLVILCTSFSPAVHADLRSDTDKAIEDAYVAILNTEKVGGNIDEALLRLNEASALAAMGGDENLKRAISLATLAQAYALNQVIQQSAGKNPNFDYYQLGLVSVVCLAAFFYVWKYGDAVYYSLWAWVRGSWRLEKS